jgi:hypothetical protein
VIRFFKICARFEADHVFREMRATAGAIPSLRSLCPEARPPWMLVGMRRWELFGDGLPGSARWRARSDRAQGRNRTTDTVIFSHGTMRMATVAAAPSHQQSDALCVLQRVGPRNAIGHGRLTVGLLRATPQLRRPSAPHAKRANIRREAMYASLAPSQTARPRRWVNRACHSMRNVPARMVPDAGPATRQSKIRRLDPSLDEGMNFGRVPRLHYPGRPWGR